MSTDTASATAEKATGFENAPEQLTPVELTIRGDFPPWLSGILYRTGPGTYSIPSASDPSNVTEIQHWFDGIAMHHRFEILPASEGQSSRVLYRSHKGAPDLEQRIAELFSFAQRQRDTDPCANFFEKVSTSFASLDDAVAAMSKRERTNKLSNVAVTMTPDFPGIRLPGRERDDDENRMGPRVIVSKTDANLLQVLDPTTLEPLDLVSYAHIDPRLSGLFSAAHACRDPETGDFYNFVLDFAVKSTYKVFKIRGDNGKADVLATISEKDAPPAYIHAMTMTSRFVIVCIWQSHIKNFGLSMLSTNNVADSIEKTWHPEKSSVFYVVDRHNGGVVAKYKTDPFFAFHYLNAYDDPETGDVVIDLSVYPNTGVLDMLYLDKMRNLSPNSKPWMGRAQRFRLFDPAKVAEKGSIPVLEAKIDFTVPQSAGVELPTLAPSKYHRAYQYAYGITRRPIGSGFSDGVIKLNMHAVVSAAASGDSLEGKEDEYAKIWRPVEHAPSEPIFAPRPGGTSEDDGVLLSIVLDSTPEKGTGQSALVVIDAKTMEEVARAEMSTIYPFGFHGVYTPERKNAL
ncbi:carotenoid oxygenase [Fomitopsis serialis]|uniref:carotenoid oxygenase n=1 Tax=Fomitopsis serialis TaxID=139415 RepID=UPI0020073172|nr:carotenoid oxygenase [Neoantrodia serialis]KAH9911044.1 carotenoid oxygenase [Neoantrodia serialis]